MAEFLTLQDAEEKFGSKGKTNAGLTLGIIGTALAGLSGGNGILGGLFGNSNSATTVAMAQGQIASDLAWANRVASMNDTAALAANLEPRLTEINNTQWENRIAGINDIAKLAVGTETRFTQLNNQDWENRVAGMQDSTAFRVYLDDKISDTNARLGTQELACANQNAKTREQDLNEKFDLYVKLSSRIGELEKAQAKTETALPLMFELNKVNAERYADNCNCISNNNLLTTTNELQRQLDHKITGQLRYAYSDLCAPVPNISPLYCSPFTQYGTGTYVGQTAANWNAVNQAFNGCSSCTAQ